ncbi:MAG: hypothetical protein ACREHV_08040, partial [Rhizomicrobium sp.]
MDASLKTRTPAQRIAQRFNSLSARLITAAAVWTLLGLLVGGYVLSGVFRSSVEGDFDARLRSDLDEMIAAAEPTAEGAVSLQNRFADPRFERVYSGWYWQITPEGPKGPLTSNAQISRSLWDRTIKVTDAHFSRGTTWGHGEGPESQRLRFVAQRIEFPVQPGAPKEGMRAYSFLVAADVTEVEDEVAKFNGTLIWSFA